MIPGLGFDLRQQPGDRASLGLFPLSSRREHFEALPALLPFALCDHGEVGHHP